MNSKAATALCFSHDSTLLMTRQWMLEQEGLAVLSVMSQPEFRAQLCRTEVHLILLCQTLAADECAAAAAFAAAYAPSARCVLMYRDTPKCAPEQCILLDATAGPADFVRNTRLLLASALPAAAFAPATRPF